MTLNAELNRLDALRDDLIATDPYWSPDAKGFGTAMNNCRNVFEAIDPATPATAVTTRHYEQLQDWLEIEKGHSNATINRHFSVLSKLIGHAVYRGVRQNKVGFKYLPEKPRDIIPYSADELLALRQVSADAKDYEWRDAFIAAELLGCRQGELLKLRYSNLCFDESPLLRFVDTKTSETRVLPLVGEVLEVMQRRYDHRTDENERVFPLNKDFLLRRLRHYQQLADVNDFRLKNWHTLRHNAVSKMWEKNVDLKTIMAVVGHRNSQTTLRVYSHTQLGEKAKALAALA